VPLNKEADRTLSLSHLGMNKSAILPGWLNGLTNYTAL